MTIAESASILAPCGSAINNWIYRDIPQLGRMKVTSTAFSLPLPPLSGSEKLCRVLPAQSSTFYNRSKAISQATLDWNSETTNQVNILAFKLTQAFSHSDGKHRQKVLWVNDVNGLIFFKESFCLLSVSRQQRSVWFPCGEKTVGSRPSLTGNQEGFTASIQDREIRASMALPRLQQDSWTKLLVLQH